MAEVDCEIQRADWVPETPSGHPGVFEELGAFRRPWVEFFKLLGRISYDSADHITSLFERNAEIQTAFDAPREKIEIVPNGIRTNDFSELGQRRREAIDSNPDRKEADYATACEELAERLDLVENIEFRGPMKRDELLVEADVMLLTSVSEGLPRAACEQALGRLGVSGVLRG